jgi:hypothetical protein
MKIQDIAFFVAFLVVMYRRAPRLSVSVGIICFLLSIPLFATWTFFTAQRLTYYGAVFILLAVLQMLLRVLRK